LPVTFTQASIALIRAADIEIAIAPANTAAATVLVTFPPRPLDWWSAGKARLLPDDRSHCAMRDYVLVHLSPSRDTLVLSQERI
jgi:hypothetical protein